MSDYIFLFDMDSTITRKEVLPEISQKINKVDEMRQLTEATMRGEIPFNEFPSTREDLVGYICTRSQ